MIPNRAHFIWIGRELPRVYLYGIASAALNGNFERVLLHHTDTLAGSPSFDTLARLARVETSRLEPAPLLEQSGGAALVDCYRDLERPAARSNVLRAALLAEQGGVYLDTDTLTLRSFAPLLAAGGAFCGAERLVFPAQLAGGVASRLRPTALARMLARDVARRLPDGHAWFRRIEHLYPTAANNAVLGAEPGHPFLRELVARMASFPRERRRVRYALGTHLLQAVVRDFGGSGLTLLPPSAFFPLGPEISEHYFRIRPYVDAGAAIGDAFVAHWYASVRTERHVARLDAPFIRAHAGRQLYSALALPVVEALEAGTLFRAIR